jgi:hypothetical protein
MTKTVRLIPYLLVSVFFLLLTGTRMAAQDSPVTIHLQSLKKEPLPFASVTVINRLDSSQVIRQVADSNGTSRFMLVKGQQYIVRVNALNYLPFEKNISATANTPAFRFTLETAGKTMEGVVLRSTRPLIRQEDDKTIVDPENLAAASSSGYEVIEKTPGLFMDQEGNIYISSLSPASVQINGRDIKMSAADIASILKSLPPTAISKIEIVRTPSAKYDASSSGGVVNVVLKKGVKIGLTGSVNAGIQQGHYGNQLIGFNLNNNDGNRSFSVNFNYSHRNSYEKIVTDRIFAPDSVLSQEAYTAYPGNTFFGSYVYSWTSKKWEFELSGTANWNLSDNKTDNQNTIEKISTSQLLTSNLNQVANKGNALVIGNGFETKLKIDSAGSEWTSQVFYYNTHNNSDQAYTTRYYTPAIFITAGDGSADNKRDLVSGRTDLRLKMKKRFTLETGLKSTLHHFKNSTLFYTENGGIRQPDANRTNRFIYKENINSAYVQGSKTMGKDVVVKFGTRLENTNMRGDQEIPSDTSFAIHRTDLFPYIYLSKSLMKIAGYDLRAYLVYRRTITRPVYEQLNPFSRYVDAYLSETGNPSLRPQFTQNYEANISVEERPIFALGVNDTKDIFTNVVYQSDSSQRQAYRTYDNLGKNKEWYFRALGALPPGGKYFFVIGTQYNHNFYEGLYENKPLAFKRGTWSFFTFHTLKLDKLSVFTLNGFWRLKGQQQFYELGSFGALNASINRKFMKDKLIVTLSVSDLFFSNNNDFTLKQGSVNASGYRQSDSRRGGINIRYNFGMRKKEEGVNMFNTEQGEK